MIRFYVNALSNRLEMSIDRLKIQALMSVESKSGERALSENENKPRLMHMDAERRRH